MQPFKDFMRVQGLSQGVRTMHHTTITHSRIALNFITGSLTLSCGMRLRAKAAVLWLTSLWPDL